MTELAADRKPPARGEVDDVVDRFVTGAAPIRRGQDADEAVVLVAAQRGDRAAQAELFQRHRDHVARQVLRMCGDPTVVDDIVQDVFIAAFSALSRFRGESKLGTWLYTIAVNRVRNFWGSTQRRKRREDAAALRLPDAVETPEHDLAASEQRELLYRTLGALPDKLREAFVARFIEGMDLAAASSALGAPISTISYRTRRAEQLLCAALDIPWREP